MVAGSQRQMGVLTGFAVARMVELGMEVNPVPSAVRVVVAGKSSCWSGPGVALACLTSMVSMWDIQGPSIRLHAVVIDFYAETTATVGEVTMSRAPRVDEAADLC
jgi:hypothetical protein